MMSGNNTGEQLTLFAEDSHAKPFPLPESVADLTTHEERFFSRLQGRPNKSNHSFFSLKTLKGYYLTRGGATFTTILTALDELGYDAEWQVLNSKNFGVPQSRERVFIIAHLRNGRGRKIFPFTSDNKQADGVQGQSHVTNTLTARYDGAGSGSYIVESEQHAQKEIGIPIKQPTKKGYVMAEPGDSVNYNYPTSTTRRGRVGKKVANTLEASGINQGVVIPVSSPEYKVKNQNGRRFKTDGEPSFTLTAQDRHGVAVEENKNFRIRKLTPLECWRLQGFTDEQFYKAKNDGVSDSQLYKQAGNSVSVPVISCIASKLQL